MNLILISGLSGAGKSVALHVMEDSGYYCVDNLPSNMLPDLVATLTQQGCAKLAVAVDIRGGESIRLLPQQIDTLRAQGLDVRFLFLDAKDETLVKRFSETRRRHPLGDDKRSLVEAIHQERQLLEALVPLGHRIDTSDFKSRGLQTWVRQFIEPGPSHGLTLMFQSFGFKHGLPLDADLVFDVRCLPNPYYDAELRVLTGKDQPVIDFLEEQADVRRMREDIRRFVVSWLPSYVNDNRAYLTVAIGCTGGQHRSVYLAEWLGESFRNDLQSVSRVLVRHRTLAGIAA